MVFHSNQNAIYDAEKIFHYFDEFNAIDRDCIYTAVLSVAAILIQQLRIIIDFIIIYPFLVVVIVVENKCKIDDKF